MARTSQPVSHDLEQLFDLTLDAFCVAGFDGYLKIVNPAFARMLGYSQDELLTRPFIDNVHPDDVGSVGAAMAELAAGHVLVGFECRQVRADGSVRWFEWNTSPEPEEGVVYAVGRDVTDRHISGDELRALRRVATLVAGGVQPQDLFAVVAEEIARVVEVPVVSIARYELDDAATECASFSTEGPVFPVGKRWSLAGTNVLGLVRQSSEPARIDDYSQLEGEIADSVRRSGLRSTVGIPIIVAGRLWGAMVVSSTERLAESTEGRLAEFTELLATAIANAESRESLARLADEQAALRRVATLVAGGVPPQDAFATVVEEVGRLLPVASAAMGRYEPDGTFTTVAAWSAAEVAFPVGRRWAPEGKNVTAIVFRTGRPARLDDFSDASGPIGVQAREAGYRSAVGSPITVEGRLWGVMTAASTADEPLPADTERRLASFTELLGTAIANTEARAEVERLAEEQAALRRVATVVAEGATGQELFASVAREVATVLDVRMVSIDRYDSDTSSTVVASLDNPGFPVGTRWPLDGPSVGATVLATASPARIDDYAGLQSTAAAAMRASSVNSVVGVPIVVEGRVWGVISVGSTDGTPVAEGTETRLAAFTELLATAIANAGSREALQQLANEQAALQRVATLVARGVPPAEIFSAVSREAEDVFGLDSESPDAATVVRFDPGPVCVLAGASRAIEGTPLGSRWQPHDLFVSTRVLRSGGSARVDEDDLVALGGPEAEKLRRQGYLSQVASPIVVEGRLWGAMTVSAGESLPPETEERLEKFTELVATAIANAEGKSELAASRRRIVAASDETRRRIERDLHDGTQQRLVSLGLAVRAAEANLPLTEATSERSCRASQWDSAPRSRTCRSSRAESTRRSSPRAVWARRCERSRAARRLPSSSTSRRTRGFPSRSRPYGG